MTDPTTTDPTVLLRPDTIVVATETSGGATVVDEWTEIDA